MKSNSQFSWKSFISIALAFSFIIIFVTGVVLYLAPAGRVAYWVNWQLMGLTKTDWQAVHTVFSYVFVILSIFHLFSMNWKVFWSYLKKKTGWGLNKKREFYMAGLLTIFIFAGILYNVQPFSAVMQFGEYLTESWENTQNEAPVTHAEKLTVPQLVEKLDGITTDQALNKLKNNQIVVNSITETLFEIGVTNNISPNELYKIISFKPTNDLAGTGFGTKPLSDVAITINKDIKAILDILSVHGMDAKETESIKDLAKKYRKPAKDIYELIVE